MRILSLFLCLAATGCPEKAVFVQGQDLSQLMLHPTSETEGIFPDVSVLDDPNNPFRTVAYRSIDAVNNKSALQWQLNASAAHAARFYIWATILAQRAPNGDGEAQYYAAAGLADVYYFAKARPEDLPRIRSMAIAGYTQVLTQFEGAVTYDASGTIGYELMTPALQAILDLDGTPPPGWILIKDSSGNPKAVKQ